MQEPCTHGTDEAKDEAGCTNTTTRGCGGASLSVTQKNIARRLLFYEALGFMILIAISWLDEWCDLPSLLFGGSPGHNWHEAALETFMILAAGVPTLVLTRRLARRLVYLEGFLRVCAWCHKIGVQDRWISVEDYFGRELRTRTSHGVCPECVAKIEHEAQASKPGTAEGTRHCPTPDSKNQKSI